MVLTSNGRPLVVEKSGTWDIRCEIITDQLCNGKCVAVFSIPNVSWVNNWVPDIIHFGFSWNGGTARWLMCRYGNGNLEAIGDVIRFNYGTNAGKVDAKDLIKSYLQDSLDQMWYIADKCDTVDDFYRFRLGIQ